MSNLDISQNFSEKSAVVFLNASIREAMSVIDRAASQGAAVLNADRKLLGMITDGDVRRALIGGAKLDDSITGIYNENAIALPNSVKPTLAQEFMVANNLRQIPFIDSEGRFIRMDVLGKGQDSSINYPIFILAGGLGTRLYPYTQHKPKPLVQLNGMTLIERVILNYRQQGAYQFVISINHMGDKIKDLLKDGCNLGVNISYVEEKKRLGTAGSLSLTTDYKNSPFIVANADVISEVDLHSLVMFHEKRKAIATMAVKIDDQQSQFGEVILDGENIRDIHEKPIHRKLVNAGIYVLEPQIRGLVKQNEAIDMPDLFRRAINLNHRLAAYPIYEEWIDVGRPEALIEAERKICQREYE